jgi:UDP:flavonoid glycosyltransferase YjiC (YdhE family)
VATVALVSGPDPGHALPVLGIGAALRRRGHEVAIWTGRRHEHLAAAHGIVCHVLPALAPEPGDHDLGTRLHARAAAMARAVAPSIADLSPELMVVDTLTRAGALVAGLLEVPYVEVVPHYLADPSRDLPPVGLGRPLPRTPWRRLDDRRLVTRQLRSVAEGHRQADATARDLGLAARPAPALRLLQTLPSLERPRSDWPDDAVVVGPLALDPDLPLLPAPDGDQPLVLVTDSTATGLDRPLGEVAVRGLVGPDLRVVVTSSAMRPCRGPGLVVGVGPHAPLLAEAAVVVSPGGGGFVAKAAAAAVPQVVVPLAGDQREAAARLRDAGVARVLRPRRLGARALRWAVVRTLADRTLAPAARRLAAEAEGLGVELAADRCLAVLAGRVP